MGHYEIKPLILQEVYVFNVMLENGLISFFLYLFIELCNLM